MSITVTDVVKFYVAMFQRAPEGEGVNYWYATANENDWDLATLAREMAKAAVDLVSNNVIEYGTYYPQYVGVKLDNLTLDQATAIVDSMYQILFNKDKTVDPDGVNFWASQLANGGDIGAVTVAMINSAEAIYADPNADAEAKAAATAFMNKVQAAEEIAKAVMTFDGNFEKFQNYIAMVTDDPTTIEAAVNAATFDGAQRYVLTEQIDDVQGTDGADVFIGTDTTSTLDIIDGLGGTDLFIYNDTSVDKVYLDSTGIVLNNIEIIELRGSTFAYGDLRGYTDVQTVNVTQADETGVTVNSDVDVNISGVNEVITVTGGNDINISYTEAESSADSLSLTVSNPSGSVHAMLDVTNVPGNLTANVTGGTDLTLDVSNIKNNTGDINVSDVENNVLIKLTTADYDPDSDDMNVFGNINVTGGNNIEIVTTLGDMTAVATDTSASSVIVGNITVTSDGTTENITIKNPVSQAAVNAVNVEGKYEIYEVKFADLADGASVIVGGLTFTNTSGATLTAEEVAQAFANLAAGATQGCSTKGIYTGTFTGDFASAEANGDTVVFTSVIQDNVVDLTATGATVTKVQDGVAPVNIEGQVGVSVGTVSINESADAGVAASIKNIVIDSYGGATLGDTSSLDALENLVISNSAGDLTLYTNVTSLNLTVDNVNNAVNLDGDNTATWQNIATLNINATGNDSTFGLTAAAVTTLNVSGDANLDLRIGSTLSALESVVVSGAAGLKMDVTGITTLTSFDASGTSGDIRVEGFDASAATYKGGSGVDEVIVANDVAKAITLGAGNDYFELGDWDITTGSVDAGEGDEDTIFMSAASLNAKTASAAFQGLISGFERVSVGTVTGVDGGNNIYTVDLANLDNISYVITNGIVDDNDATTADDNTELNITNLSNNGTVVIQGEILSGDQEAKLNVSITNADTNTADVLNLIASSGMDLSNTGSVEANDIETINITSDDANKDDDYTPTHTLNLSADSVTSIVVTGDANLELNTISTTLTSIDASGMTASLVATMANDNGTIIGGSGDDTLTATGSQDVLQGGAGNDMLVVGDGATVGAGDLATLTGGEGMDWFVINNIPTDVNSYATITDIEAGEIIQIPNLESFNTTKIVLGDTAVFQDYANAAVNTVDASAGNAAAWFQYGGNTYIVVDVNTSGDGTYFVNGEDMIVKIEGLVDLSTASFNNDQDTIMICG